VATRIQRVVWWPHCCRKLRRSYDVGCEEDNVSKPASGPRTYALVVTNTRASYEWAAKSYKEDRRSIDKLRGMLTAGADIFPWLPADSFPSCLPIHSLAGWLAAWAEAGGFQRGFVGGLCIGGAGRPGAWKLQLLRRAAGFAAAGVDHLVLSWLGEGKHRGVALQGLPGAVVSDKAGTSSDQALPCPNWLQPRVVLVCGACGSMGQR
jgi:hypothetical protein